MIDPVLERNTADCTEILEHWRKFHDHMAAAVKNEAITPEREADFLAVKSRIAMLHDSFMASLTADRNIGQSMLTIVSRAITLHHLARMSVAEIKKMEIEWHQAYLLLQETLGNLEERRAKLAQVSEAAYKAEKFRTNVKQTIDRIIKSNAFVGLLILLAILFVTVGVQVLGIWDWASLRNYGPTRAAFYYVYDKGLRHVFGHLPYYRLTWVDIPVSDDESRDFLPGGYWVWRKDQQANLDPQCQISVKDEVLPRIGLPEATLSAIRGASDYSEIWFYNSNDYICMALFLMDSTTRARELADDIRRAVSGAGERNIGAGNRANILIVFFFSQKDNAPQSRDAFSEFINRGGDLIW